MNDANPPGAATSRNRSRRRSAYRVAGFLIDRFHARSLRLDDRIDVVGIAKGVRDVELAGARTLNAVPTAGVDRQRRFEERG